MKVQDTKSGNPYHDEEGKFTEKDNVGQASEVDENYSIGEKVDDIELDADDNVDDIELDMDAEDIELDPDIEDIELDDEDLEEQFDVDLEENTVSLTPEQEEIINSLDFGELERELLNSALNDFDKEKIFNASPEELRELLKAEYIVKEKNKLILTNKELNEINTQSFSGLWMKDVFPSDYKDLKENWVKKYNYFENDYNKEDKDEKLGQLLKFKELGEFYESSYNELFSSVKQYEELLDKYLDPNSAYSTKRKNAALWIKGDTYSVVNQSLAAFGKHADELINQLKAFNPQAWEAIYFYTGSYSIINEPLRKEKYGNYNDPSPFGFTKTVQKMTEAIDSSVYDFDYWCQRGTSKLKISDSLTIDYYTDEQTLQSLIGQTFKHQSFYSAGAGKGTGFSGGIIINTYCPKGTKGFYMNTQGHYSGGHENEMILQRGYSYKITKVEKHGSQIYLDVDVILGSDKTKYNDEELKQLSIQYASGK